MNVASASIEIDSESPWTRDELRAFHREPPSTFRIIVDFNIAKIVLVQVLASHAGG